MENLEPPATLKKSFFLDSGGIDATWLQPTAEDVANTKDFLCTREKPLVPRVDRCLNLFKTILYILYFGLCLHSTDFGTGAIVTRNGMIIHMISRCNTILRGSVHFLG